MISSAELQLENSQEALLQLNREYQRLLDVRNCSTADEKIELLNEDDIVKRTIYTNRIGRFPFFLREDSRTAPSPLDTVVLSNSIIKCVDNVFNSKEDRKSSADKNACDGVIYPILLDAYISFSGKEDCTNLYEKYCLVAVPKINNNQYDAVVVNVIFSEKKCASAKIQILDLRNYSNCDIHKAETEENRLILQIIYQKSSAKHLDIGKSAFIRYLERCRDWVSTSMNPMQRSVVGFPHPSNKIWKDCNALQQMYWRYPDIDVKDYNTSQYKLTKEYNDNSCSSSSLLEEESMKVGCTMNKQACVPPDGITSNDPLSNLHDKARFVYPEVIPKSALSPLPRETNILSKKQINQFLNDGYLLVNGLYDDTLLQSALKDVKIIWPKTFESQRYFQNSSSSQYYFPFDHTSLNKITLHPNLLRIVSQLMDIPIHRIRITQSACFAKRGPPNITPKQKKRRFSSSSESNCNSNYFEDGNQPIHQDFGNNTLLTTNTLDKPVEIQAMLYYNNFEEIGGGTSFVPGLFHTSANPFHLGWLPDAEDMMIRNNDDGYSSSKEIDPRPALYKAERIAAYTFGSILFYTLGTWHRGK